MIEAKSTRKPSLTLKFAGHKADVVWINIDYYKVYICPINESRHNFSTCYIYDDCIFNEVLEFACTHLLSMYFGEDFELSFDLITALAGSYQFSDLKES